MSSQEKKSFKQTLNLPKTDFSIRASAKTKEPELLERWRKEDLYNRACKQNEGEKSFVLHDGPPFANGHMHMGHALNRTLKDIVCKAKRMLGFHVVSVPGWDCHGLPIALKVAKELGVEKKIEEVDRIKFKEKCRAFAQKWIDIQSEEIKRLGVVTDWDNPYITMSPCYEGSIIKCFAEFVEKGYIERKEKTVPWCASCRTVLAAAEIEYKDRKDPSCYILFLLENSIAKSIFPELLKNNPKLEINLLVWTTTPWTIPLNRAVVLHPTASYVLLHGREQNQAFIVGADLADSVCKNIGVDKKIIKEFKSVLLKSKKVQHPYIENLSVPIILDYMVLLDDGTACVHSAPGCGPEDYILGIKNNLEIFSPLSVDGKYTDEIQPKELDGMSIEDGQIWSIKKMHEKGKLLHKTSITHSYPYCWRCHRPLMFRATTQWFCDLKKDNLVDRAIKEAEKLQFLPDWGKVRLTSSMASRAEWCLSRQHQWGVPIPALFCNRCDNPYISANFIRGVSKQVSEHGIEFWDKATIDDLINLGIISSDFICEKCGNSDLSQFRKEQDILDVWFESGVSHTAVYDQYNQMEIPADLYLEGSDQHRGWFQSSLLSSMIMYQKTCTKSFVTHAYVLDAQEQKMSKSKGNIIAPQDVIDKYSADILRLWVAGSDFEDDIVVAEEVLGNVAGVYRKIRNTCRFMISNLYDFDIKKDFVSIDKMFFIDQLALAKLQEVSQAIQSAYEQYKFTTVFRLLNNYCTNNLSSFYLDILKDRLYVEKSDGIKRRSAQTVMYNILDTITRLMAPILSFLAEEISDFYQKEKTTSIHLQDFWEPIDIWSIVLRRKMPGYKMAGELLLSKDDSSSVTFVTKMKGYTILLEEIRSAVLKAIEELRESGEIKHSLEAKLAVYIDGSVARESLEQVSPAQAKILQEFISYLEQTGEDVNHFFKDFFIVSQFKFVDSSNGLKQSNLSWLHVGVDHADGVKCPRCWQWDETDDVDGLCKRCKKVLK